MDNAWTDGRTDWPPIGHFKQLQVTLSVCEWRTRDVCASRDTFISGHQSHRKLNDSQACVFARILCRWDNRIFVELFLLKCMFVVLRTRALTLSDWNLHSTYAYFRWKLIKNDEEFNEITNTTVYYYTKPIKLLSLQHFPDERERERGIRTSNIGWESREWRNTFGGVTRRKCFCSSTMLERPPPPQRQRKCHCDVKQCEHIIVFLAAVLFFIHPAINSFCVWGT